MLEDQEDLWPIVLGHLRELVGDLPVGTAQLEQVLRAVDPVLSEGELEAKYRRGEQEHQRDWLGWKSEDFEVALREELVDLVLYVAMRRTLGC